MSIPKASKGGDLTTLLGGGQESPIPNPDIPILIMRAIAALILALWYGGQVAQVQLLAWADQAQLAYTRQSNGTWEPNRPVRFAGEVVHWWLTAPVQHALAWVTLVLLSMLLLELIGLLLLLQRHLSRSRPRARWPWPRRAAPRLWCSPCSPWPMGTQRTSGRSGPILPPPSSAGC